MMMGCALADWQGATHM